MTTDLDLPDVVDAIVVDDRCAQHGMPYCPGNSAPVLWLADPYDADIDNTHRLVYLHDDCAAQLAADI